MGFIITVAGAAVVSLTTMLDITVRMEAAREVLCGGETAFVYAVDDALGVVNVGMTDELPEIDFSSNRFFAVLQALDLDVAGYEDVHGGFVSRVHQLSTVPQLSVVDTVTNIDESYKGSDADALEAVECKDHDDHYAYILELQRRREDDTIASCQDLVSYCHEEEIRMFCASTCQCDTMAGGMYQRIGCSSSCQVPIIEEVRLVSEELFVIHENSILCSSHVEGWMDNFAAELQVALMDAGHLELTDTSTYVWTSSFNDSFVYFAKEEFYLSSAGLDISAWLDFNVGNGLCDTILYFDLLLDTNLCNTLESLALSLGTLEGLCPQACGLCEQDTVDTETTLLAMYMQQGVDLKLGLIDFPIVGKIVTHASLSCNSTVSASTIPSTESETSMFGNDSPERVYAFYSAVNQTVSFSTCGDANYNSLIRVLDVYFQEIDSNNDSPDCSDFTSYLEVELEAEQQVYVVIEGDLRQAGSFNLAVGC